MDHCIRFGLVFPSDVLPYDRQSLLLALLYAGNQELPSGRLPGVDEQVVPISIKGRNHMTSTATDMARLGWTIAEWCRDARQRQQEVPKIRLEHPDRQGLDLRSAADTQILEWFARLFLDYRRDTTLKELSEVGCEESFDIVHASEAEVIQWFVQHEKK